MISNVFPTGRYVQVSGGTASTYVNGYSGAQGIGNMRYNTSSQRMEVFDGSGWVQLNMGSVSVGLNGEAESLLDWAREKCNQELEWQNLAASSEAVKIALENLEQAKHQLAITAHLAKEINETTS
jgi:hypothetical protein